ncbi:MAG: pantoate--beta-alanine ligase [Bacteroidetes bacterium]|nr:pantoate--beta-alanine ligase [Bacteroidota bacterium]
MKVFKKTLELKNELDILSKQGKKIGFVPTMGALHHGHIELVVRSVKDNDITVASIFVNPTQFNNPEDLKKYPRMPEKDIAMLENANCDYVFLPDYDEVYPKIDTTNYDFGMLEKVMEGKFRPGHFKGVGMVVKRLFEIVEPDNAYFGLKDYQQFLVIKSLVNQFDIPVNIVGCETIREHDGLAMSSRNLRLSDEQRKEAPEIYKSLSFIKKHIEDKSVLEWKQWFKDKINALSQLKVEYIEISDAITLEEVSLFDDSKSLVICVAVFAGEIRLIDNVLIND